MLNIKIYILFIITQLSLSITTNIGVISSNKSNNKNLLRNLFLNANLYGSSDQLNYYYINLYLGDNKQKQSLFLDTGSSITSIPCQPLCKYCGNHINSYYNINSNSQILNCNDNQCSSLKSYCEENNNFCSFQNRYLEGSSIEGVYIKEKILINDKLSIPIPIGCITYEDNLYYVQKVDGIIGLANTEKNFITLLYKNNIIQNNIFSICIHKQGGYFSFGEINNTFHKQKIYYTPMSNSYTYNINITNIKINNIENKAIKEGGYNAFIDSGTTYTYIPFLIYKEMTENIKNICNSYENKNSCGEFKSFANLGLCFIFNNFEEQYKAINNFWPDISFFIEDYEFLWTPKNYIFNYTKGNKLYGCMGFSYKYSNQFILGTTWMTGHEIIFDKQNKKIGIVEADCSQGNKINIDNEKNLQEDKNIFDVDVNEGKNSFIFYLIILIFLTILVCILIVAVWFLRKGKSFLFFKFSALIEEDFLGMNNDKGINFNDINHINKNNKKENNIEMTNSMNYIYKNN